MLPAFLQLTGIGRVITVPSFRAPFGRSRPEQRVAASGGLFPGLRWHYESPRTVPVTHKCGSTEQMLQKLRPVIALLDKYKKPYDIVYTNFVGTIVYEDDWQVAVSVKDGKMV